MIRVQNLGKKFGELEAVKDISFEVKPGELFAFLGPNGAGKTTTIKMLTTLLAPTSGSIRIDGLDPAQHKNEVRSRFGIVFQDPSVDGELTAWENMDLHGVLYHVPRKVRHERTEQLLKLFELWEKKDQRMKTFSGGMKRRLEIARGFLHTPKILFLDEPTLGLDPQSRNQLWTHVKALNESQKVTVFLTTHYMDEAERCDRLAYLAYGNLLARGTVAEVIATGKLTTWTISGPDLRAIAARLRGADGVEQVVAFGNTLHVSGRDGGKVDAAISAVRDDTHVWTRVNPGLEDVFIGLMDNARDNFS
jgi:ABC-2 type transport system ATP-binding protein